MKEGVAILALVVRNEIIKDGVAEVESTYADGCPERIGGLEGFRLCEALETPEQYRDVLAARMRAENDRRIPYGDALLRAYQEHRYATLQVEHVYDRLCVVWGLGPTYSARAVVQVAEVLERIQT